MGMKSPNWLALSRLSEYISTEESKAQLQSNADAFRYLLIDVPVATPLTPVQTFRSTGGFPVENRPMEGHLQDFASLANYRRQYVNLPEFFRDFHLLVYLGTQSVHPLDDELLPLLSAIRDEKTEKIFAWAESNHWHTIEALIQNYNDGYQ